MRLIVASLLVVGCVSAPAAFQTSGGAAAGKPRLRACALLTRELIDKFATAESKRVLHLVPPQEDMLGAHGSACEYGGIGFQIDPFARPEEIRKSLGKEWQAVAGVGDTAYFRSNRNNYAELMVWTGTHHFTIQMSVPTGATAESIRPNTIGLANALIPKLR